jgi:hypothetical protein
MGVLVFFFLTKCNPYQIFFFFLTRVSINVIVSFMKKLSLLLLLGLLISANSMVAAVFASYSFGGSTLNSNDSDTDTIAGSISSGAGLASISFESRGFWVQSTSGPNAWKFDASADANDGTVLDNDYFQFTLTPVGGVTLDFTSLTFEERSGGATVSVATSLNSFTTVVGSTASSGSWAQDSIDLSSLSNSSTAVDFRLYFSGGSTTNFVIDDIQLNGAVVPEPSSYALLAGMLGLTWVMLRRRS